jgi:hypothetical protein
MSLRRAYRLVAPGYRRYLTAGGSVPEFLVDPVGNVQELLMCPGLNNAAAMKNEDNVRVPEKSSHKIL